MTKLKHILSNCL